MRRPVCVEVYDCMNGVQGPYAKRILVETLGGDASSILNGESMEVACFLQLLKLVLLTPRD